ncbi:hypothetical protein [Halobellus sp. GM3]|uniref:hypothetical protein n=1 Tax=Halobellus sp. GM3 TaxID=3458410 RepID=UPI00403DF7DE
MSQQNSREKAMEVGRRTGRDPIVLAAAGSVLLAWYQYYVRGNKEHGLFIGLWPPTMLAFSNAVHIEEIREEVGERMETLLDREP